MNRVNIRDVAKRAGVSIATVSQVLTNASYSRISQKTKMKILKIAKELDYTPNILARGLITRRTSFIGVLIPDIVNSFFPDILQGIENILIEKDYSMILCTYDKNYDKEKKYLKLLIKKNVDGIIWAPSKNIKNLYKEFIPWKQKIILICYDSYKYFTALHPNNKLGGYLATEYLIKKGCKNIAHLSSSKVDIAGSERFKGYKKALIKYGILFKKEMVMEGDYTLEWGYNNTKKLFSQGLNPDGIFACSDIVAIGAITYLKEKGYKIPDDIKIIGYDDIPIASLVSPKLTTISQPKIETGQKAVQMIFDMLNKKQVASQTLTPHLIIRESA